MELPHVQTTCPYFGIGFSFYLFVRDDKEVGTSDYRSPENGGKVCPEGTYAWQFISNKNRLKTSLKPIKFEEAIRNESR